MRRAQSTRAAASSFQLLIFSTRKTRLIQKFHLFSAFAPSLTGGKGALERAGGPKCKKRYLSEDEVLGFVAREDSEEEEEISDSEWVSTDDGEEDREEISSCDSSSEGEMDEPTMFLCCCKLLRFQNRNVANNTLYVQKRKRCTAMEHT